MAISRNIETLQKRILTVCKSVGRNPQEIKIVAASKYANIEQVKEACRAGIQFFGENKVQDLLLKQEVLKDLPIKWHFIGRLQSNKVSKLVGKVVLIHSVDSAKLAQQINKIAQKANIKQEILLQVNISEEQSKGGFKASESLQKLTEIGKLEAIEVKGLMTIAPLTTEEKILSDHFSESKNLFDRLRNELGPGFEWLSMGMSNDFEMALRYGANMLRLGSVIFR